MTPRYVRTVDAVPRGERRLRHDGQGNAQDTVGMEPSGFPGRLSLHLLGGFSALGPAGLLHLESAKTEALLADLALSPGEHPRPKLHGFFWSDLPEGRPAGYNERMAGVAPCARCGGSRFVLVERDGKELAVRCSCLDEWRREAALAAVAIPERYRHCTVESFEIWNPNDPTLVKARRRTQELVDAFPAVERGLLFMGRVGTGKTHLAVAALRALVADKGAEGLYVNVTELIQQLQMSIDGAGPSREEILQPVVDARVLVLDELGACRSTEWVLDQLYFVINSRYMRQRLTLVTTNYFDSPQPVRPRPARSGGEAARALPEAVERWQETLADRITDRLRSRLYEMCDSIELRGEDYRSRERTPGGRRR